MRVRINYERLVRDTKAALQKKEGSALTREIVEHAIGIVLGNAGDTGLVAKAWLGNLRISGLSPDEVLEKAAREVIKDSSIGEVLPYLEVTGEGRSENG